MIKQGEWVRIHQIVLKPEERALASLPEDTRKLPLEMWVKGWLVSDGELGQRAEVVTRCGRRVQGVLEEVRPCYTHSFGAYIPELEQAGDQAVAFLFGGEK